MPVVVIAITVVVQCEAIETTYPGGMKGFQEVAVPNNTFCTDGELACASFMMPPDVGKFVEHLQEHGLRWLVPVENEEDQEEGRVVKKALDLVVVDQNNGPCNNCDWIHFGKQGSISFCWIGDESPEGRALSAPEWWTPAKSESMNFVPEKAVQAGGIEFRKHEEEEEEESAEESESKLDAPENEEANGEEQTTAKKNNDDDGKVCLGTVASAYGLIDETSKISDIDPRSTPG
ncbi:expressed unknown protein [Seminavis robusta]|uniref:Uncharacterized protein n=1 Tax=Seminavis robusta TaxID=568900 RepID=A0A9N8DQ37_9STRA|nr:expressed unknown protein [Seminavis robusta]|eukprot:Sro274_g105500.1 n/a (233) ;mRNA; f:55487-56185